MVTHDHSVENQKKWKADRLRKLLSRISLPEIHRQKVDSERKNNDRHGHTTVGFYPSVQTLQEMRKTRKFVAGRSITCTKCWRFTLRSTWADTKPCAGEPVKPRRSNKTWVRFRLHEVKTAEILVHLWGTSFENADVTHLHSKDLAELKKDLLIQQGIEPNPGPSLDGCDVQLFDCNVRSANGAWSLLEFATTCKGDHELCVFCLQETRMNKAEQAAYQRAAHKRGFQVFWQTGQTSKDRWNKDRENGGVAILVDRRLHATSPYLSCGAFSQILGVWVEGWFITTFYSPPKGLHDLDPHHELCELFHDMVVQVGMNQVKWITCGDANVLPGDSQLISYLSGINGQILSIGQGTRWNSDREIDWFVTNSRDLVEFPPKAVDQVFSDHIAISVTLRIGHKDLKLRMPVKGPVWTKPREMPTEDWQDLLHKTWNQHHLARPILGTMKSDVINVNDEWNYFMGQLDCLMRSAYSQVLEDFTVSENTRNSMLRSLRNRFIKGTKVNFSERIAKRTNPSFHKGDMRLTKLRKRVARLYEFRRCHQKLEDDPSPQILWTHRALQYKLRLSDAHTMRETHQALTEAKVELSQMEKEQRDERLANWRRKFQTDLKFASRWLKQRCSTNGIKVNTADGPTTSSKEGVKAIVGFWTDFWVTAERDHPAPQDIAAAIGEDVENCAPEAWQFPRGIDIKAKIHGNRSAAGIDDWSGSEVSHLPEAVWDLFVQLTERWLQAQQVPDMLFNTRVAMLPKPEKVYDGVIDPKDCRPITIMSIFLEMLDVLLVSFPSNESLDVAGCSP